MTAVVTLWFLVLSGGSGGTAVIPAPYPSEEACEQAAEQALAASNSDKNNRSFSYLCVAAPQGE